VIGTKWSAINYTGEAGKIPRYGIRANNGRGKREQDGVHNCTVPSPSSPLVCVGWKPDLYCAVPGLRFHFSNRSFGGKE
jgi:hypothetical protein